MKREKPIFFFIQTKSSRSRVTTSKREAKNMTTMATQGAFLRLRTTSSSKSVAKPTELGFLSSQLSGLRISHGPSNDVINRISLPSFPGTLQPIVARKFLPLVSLKSFIHVEFRFFRIVVFWILSIRLSTWRQSVFKFYYKPRACPFFSSL